MILQLRPSSTISAIWPKVMHGRQQVTKPAQSITEQCKKGICLKEERN